MTLIGFTRDPRLSAYATSATAAWLWSADATHVLWANAAGAMLMGAASAQALTVRQLAADQPIPAQIARLAGSLPPTGAPRLERLRGIGTGVGGNLVCACSRISLPDGVAILVVASEAVKPTPPLAERVKLLFDECEEPIAVLSADGTLIHAAPRVAGFGTLAGLGAAALAAQALASGRAEGESARGHITIERLGSGAATVLLVTLPEQVAPAAAPAAPEPETIAAAEPAPEPAAEPVATVPAQPEAAPEPAAEVAPQAPDLAPASEPDVVETAQAPAAPEPVEPGPVEPPKTEPPEPARKRPYPLRFVWEMDAEQSFTLTSADFLAGVGQSTAALMGRPWSEIAAALGIDPEGRVARAVASHDTWSGETVLWPVDGSDGRIEVELSGLPVFDRERAFRGYRGFGVCRDVTRLVGSARPEAPQPASPQAAEPAPPPTQERKPVAPPPAEPQKPAADTRPVLTVVPAAKNVVPFRAVPTEKRTALTPVERSNFHEIAEQLGAKLEGETAKETVQKEPAAPETEKPEQAPERPQPVDTKPEESTDWTVTLTTPPASSEPRRTRAVPSAFAVGDPAAAARAAVAESEGRQILDRLPVAILVHRNDALVYANNAFLEWTGYADLVAIAAAGGLERLVVEPGGTSDKAGGRSFRIATRSGETLALEGRLMSVAWEGESALMLTLARTSADDRVRNIEPMLHAAEAEAREAKSILDTATDGIAVVDREGRILSLNRSAEALFGYEYAELARRPFTELFAPESERTALDYLDGLMRAGVASLLNDGREVIGRVRQGGLIPLFMTMGRIGEANEKFCAVFRDITQWKRAEEDLLNAKRQAEKASSAKSDFLAKVSHEIRTPLNAIIGFSEVMLESRFGPIGNERYQQYLKDIHESGQHLVSLINDLLDLSKIEAGKLDLNFASVSLNELTQQCVALMQPQANRERIIIRTSLSPSLPPVVVDARSVKQIVLNLLSNSIKFTGAGGQVIVSSALTERGEAVLRVRDTGIGMTEKEIETAMEPFRQLPTSTRWGSGGTGLGLPLTKALAEANRASFAIKSAVNAGTLVEVVFPATRVLAE